MEEELEERKKKRRKKEKGKKSNWNEKIWSWLVVVYGISTFVGYLKPNPVYTYIKYIRLMNK